MKDIGNQLREAREKRKLSIQDVAIATKINNKVIKSIEDGDMENLPAKPFLRGFVQTYARYLELNVDDVMKKFLEIQGSTTPKPQITEEGRSFEVSHEAVQNKFELYKKLAYVGATIIAIIVIYFIQKTVSRYEQESKVAKEQQQAVKSQMPVELPIATVAPSTPAETQESVPPISSDVKSEEKKPDVKEEAKKEVEVKKEEPKKEEKKPEVAAPPALIIAPKPEVKKEEPTPAEVKKELPKPVEVKKEETKPVEVKKVEEKKPEEKKVSKSQQIIIEALDNVEIRYTKDGEGSKSVKLKPEEILTIKAETKVDLNVSDSGAVNIIHNGRDKGVPGNLGQPIKLTYP